MSNKKSVVLKKIDLKTPKLLVKYIKSSLTSIIYGRTDNVGLPLDLGIQ